MLIFRCHCRAFSGAVHSSCPFKAPMPKVRCDLDRSYSWGDGLISSPSATYNDQSNTTDPAMDQARDRMGTLWFKDVVPNIIKRQRNKTERGKSPVNDLN